MPVRLMISSALGPIRARRRAELFGSAMSRALDQEFEVLIASSYVDLSRDLLRGKADMAWCPAAVCAKVERDARSLFAAVRDGVTSYHAALVCRHARRLNLQSLAGTRAAWVDKFSYGGYLLVREYLRRQRMDPNRVFSSQKFYGSYPKAVDAVLEDRADVTSITASRSSDDAVRRSMAAFVGPRASRLGIVAVTDSIPSDGLAIMKNMDDDLAERIEDVLSQARAHDDVCKTMSCEGFRRAGPGDYRVVGLTRLL